ncbi:MAG: hypothetical protein JST20_06300 [Bacteroidetes bacterium]|nr:hypothetical protein [Bacteroidota bacterium]
MKKTMLLVIASINLLLLGCPFNSALPPVYSEYEPILVDRSALSNISFSTAIPVSNTGKIYSYNNYILINEIDKGYHIIDNSNPINPKNVGFLKILASREVVIRNNILYSDNASDLISVDVSDIAHPTIISRTENIFPAQLPPDNLPLSPEYVVNNRPANTVIIEWRKR